MRTSLLFIIFLKIIGMNNSFFQGVSDYTISSFKMLKATQSQTGGCEVIIRSSNLEEALSNLQQYNDEYLLRMKTGRAEGKSPKLVEFARAQHLKADGIKREWTMLRDSLLVVRNFSSQIVLGIMAESGDKGVDTLKSWVSGLGLPKGMLHAVDENNQRLQLETASDMLSKFQSIPVYIKYNSSEGGQGGNTTTIAGGDAYIKPFEGSFTGVIFQPKILSDDNFYQFGNLPSAIFKSFSSP